MSTQLFITDILKQLKSQYVALIQDAEMLFAEYEMTHAVYERELKRFREAKQQLETIMSFKKNNGYYPTIKDHPDTEAYLKELKNISGKAQDEIEVVEPKVLRGYRKRKKMLYEIADTIIHQTLKEKDASKFVATMVLRAPLPNDQARCPNNEKNKPLYIAALAMCLIRNLAEKNLIDDEHILDKLPPMVPSAENPKIKEPHPSMIDDYIAGVLRPIVIAILIHQIGSYSQEAERLFKGNRYRLLDEGERKQLIEIVYRNSKNYLKYGLGKPDLELFENEGATDYKDALAAYELTEDILENYVKATHPIANILRIPMIYSSFMLSTKPKHEYPLVYKAYDVIQSGINKNIIYAPYANEFLNMVGRFPLGTGLFFIAKDTGQPEKAVVTGLNPPDHTSAIAKQMTRRQIRFDEHSQTLITKDFNIIYEVARRNSDFGSEYFAKQYPNGYIWNPAESWELEIDHKTFWRRDNNLKQN